MQVRVSCVMTLSHEETFSLVEPKYAAVKTHAGKLDQTL